VALLGDPSVRLSIASDDDKIVIAREAPIINGEARCTRMGSITDIVAVRHRLWTTCPADSDGWADSTVSESAPGTAPALVILIVGFLVALLATVAASRAMSAWLGVPLGLVMTICAATGAFIQQDRAERSWRNGHHVLRHPLDRQALHKGRAAATQIIEAWPKLGALVEVADPTPALATALWELARLLAHRQTVRHTRDELLHAAVGLPPDSRVWREVAARREQAETELAAFDRETGRRLAYLAGLAGECSQFVLEQAALAQARTAVRRADMVLSQAIPVAPAGNAGAEVAARTHAVLVAYRELTNHLGVDDI
jgi:hypothetical protein